MFTSLLTALSGTKPQWDRDIVPDESRTLRVDDNIRFELDCVLRIERH